MMWLVPLLIGLVIFAAALGYFLGRQSGSYARTRIGSAESETRR